MIQLKHVIEIRKPSGDVSTTPGRAYFSGQQADAFVDRGTDLVNQVSELKIRLTAGAAAVKDRVRVKDRAGAVLYDWHKVVEVQERARAPDTITCRSL